MNEEIAQSYQVDFVFLKKENTFLNTIDIEEKVQEGGEGERGREKKRESLPCPPRIFFTQQ